MNEFNFPTHIARNKLKQLHDSLIYNSYKIPIKNQIFVIFCSKLEAKYSS